MKQRIFRSTVLLVFLQLSVLASADQITMADGSVINGRIVRLEDNTIIFETKFAGTLNIDTNEVLAVHTTESVTAILNGGDIMHNQSIETRDDQLVLSGKDAVVTEVAMSQIKKINPAPWEMGIGYVWSGEFSLAVKRERGNTDADETDLRLDTVWRSIEDRYTVRGNLEIDENQGDETKNKWGVLAKYDRFLGESLYWGWNAGLDKDEFANLDSRFFLGPYVGKIWYEQVELDLATELGLVYVFTDFTDSDPDRGNSEDYPGVSWNLRASSQILGLGSKIYFNHFGIWNTTESSEAFLKTTVGIKFDLIEGLLTAAEYQYDFDNAVTGDADEGDETLRFQVGYEW